MAAKSLGAMYREHLQSKLREDENKALQEFEILMNSHTLVTRARFGLVKTFFEQLMTRIRKDIRAKGYTEPYILWSRDGETLDTNVADILRICDWGEDPEERINIPGAPYNPLWNWFAGWGEANELVIELRCEPAAKAEENSYLLERVGIVVKPKTL